MIQRLAKLPKNNSFFLFGARATGKTSLLRSLFPEGPNVLYIDLLNEDLYQRYLVSPQLLKNEVDAMKTKPEWIVIDEVQRVPKLLNIAHQLIESKDKIKFALTGSSSRRLKQKGVNLLAGRAWLRSLYPLTYVELNKNFNLKDILNWGSLPKIITLKDPKDRADFLKAYSTTYIKTEIQEEQWVRKLEPFLKFLPIAAQMNGKPLNFSSLAREAGVEVSSIRAYYEILEDTLLGFHLESYHKSVRKQQRVAPKFYFFDLGVKKSLQKILDITLSPKTSEWGMAFEHLVISEVFRLNEYTNSNYKLSYLQTKDDFEIDLILEKPQKKTIFIEIKSTDKIHATGFTRFSNFVKEQKGKGYVLSNDPIKLKESSTQFLPWQEGLSEIFDLKSS